MKNQDLQHRIQVAGSMLIEQLQSNNLTTGWIGYDVDIKHPDVDLLVGRLEAFIKNIRHAQAGEAPITSASGA